MTDTPIFDAVKADLGGDPRTPIARTLDSITAMLAGLVTIFDAFGISVAQRQERSVPELYAPLRWSTLDIAAPIYERLVRERGRPAMLSPSGRQDGRTFSVRPVPIAPGNITVRTWLVGDPA